MSRLRLAFHKESWPLAAPFRFAGHTIASSDVVVVTLTEGAAVGQGEATGVIYLGETPDSICAQIAAVAGQVEAGAGRDDLRALLPPGGARNAIDCALWDLECKRAGQTIWDRLDLTPQPVLTCNTVGLDPVPTARVRAAALTAWPLLKVKVDRDDPVGRVAAIRQARPDARLILDANGAWDIAALAKVAGAMQALGVEMIEQPLPAGADEPLADFTSPIPLCADESCLVAADVPDLAGRYSLVNIKLDKCGGLTEALDIAHAARAAGLETMVGNMIGTSLSMAPNLVIAQTCLYADLDGPLALVRDRAFGLEYRDGEVSGLQQRLWG